MSRLIFFQAFFAFFTACSSVYPQNFPPQNFPSEGETKSDLNLLNPLENCWIYPTFNKSDFATASDNEEGLYVPLLEGRLISIDSIFGEKKWETELGGEIISETLVDSRNIYIASGSIGSANNSKNNKNEFPVVIRSLNRISGIVNWETGFSNNFAVYLSAYRTALILVANNGSLSAISKTDGRIIWSKNLYSDLTAVPFLNGSRILLGFKNRIVTMSLDEGKIIEELKISDEPTTIFKTETGNDVFWGDKKGFLTSFNLKSKKINWKFRKGAEISNVISTSRGFLVISQDNFLYLISEKSGNLIWKKRLSNRISVQPLILDNYAIFTTIAEPNAVIVELKTGKSVNNITLSTENFFTGSVIKSGNRLIFSTLKGIFAFSNQKDCRSSGNN